MMDWILAVPQYVNLRDCFTTILVDPILGEDYYNYAQNVYECDRQKCLDIAARFREVEKKYIFWKGFALSIIASVCLYLLYYYII